MIALLAQYPYLWTSLVLVVIACTLIVFSKGLRPTLFMAGFIGMLFGFFSFEFIPWYWDPEVTVHLIASPEDLLFSFATGVITWWLASLAVFDRLELETIPGPCFRRAIVYSVPGVAIAYSLALTIMNHMAIQTTLIGVSVMGLVFLWLKREFWHSALLSSTIFTFFYSLLLLAAFAIWPSFHLAWKPGIQPAFQIFGLPPFEIFWALGYGFVFPLYLLLVFNARLRPVSEQAMVQK